MVGQSKQNLIEVDEVSIAEASDPLGEHQTLDDRDMQKDKLPCHVTVEMTFTRNGKVIGQPDQHNIEPDMTFEEFQTHMTENVDDIVGLSNDLEEVKFAWKWERRVTQSTAAKKPPIPYSVLSRERHWEAVLQVLREANTTKNGCHNMLLRIQASIIPKDDQSQSEVIEIDEPSGRIVFTFCLLLTIDCNITTALKTCQHALF